MSSKVKAKPQTFTTNLYGSATTDSGGTTYNPSAFENSLINMTTSYIPQYLEQLADPSYDSEVFQARTQQRNRLANQSFENNVINPLSERGLTRGSSINQMSNQFANKLADLEVDAMAEEDDRNAEILDNLFNYYQVPYDMMLGISNLSNRQYQQSVQNAMTQNALNSRNLNNLSNTFGNMADDNRSSAAGGLLGGAVGGYFGGPAGAQVGSVIGSQFGSWW